MLSLFQPVSIGLVAENKEPGTRWVNCYPLEDSPALDGEITYAPETRTLSGQDADGNAYDIKIVNDATYPAEWLPSCTNRVTPPDVQRGELVMIYRLGDTDQYYWRCLGLRDNLRRLETVIWAFNASPDPSSKNGVNFETCYFLEISTHNKTITIGTSKANGEPYAYTAQINAREGAVNIADDVGNFFELDSPDRRLQLMNGDGSFFKVEKKHIEAKADEYIKLTSGNTELFMDPNNYKVTTKAVNVDAATYLLKSGSVVVETSSYDVNRA